MISILRGHLIGKGDGFAIVDVGGIGFRVQVPASLLDRLGPLGREITLYTHLHVRENEIALFGCSTEEEQALFEMLLGVPGIGPKVALGILSHVSPETLREIIAQGDVAALRRIPGIGKKTAERLMLDLKDKLGGKWEVSPVPLITGADAEVIAALTALGYSVTEARAALSAIPEGELPLEERVRAALQYFAREPIVPGRGIR